MRLPYSWVQTYVSPLPKPGALAEQLTIAGISADRIDHSALPDTIIVGRVVSVEPHPHAQRLRIARVETKKGRVERIVCGAPNLAAEQRVAVALPGTTLPNGATIAAATIRGVVSAGMICAEDELGLGDDHTGILVLQPGAQIGAPLHTILDTNDVVLDLDVTPNRADCLSVLGCAREIAAVTGARLRLPKQKRLHAGNIAPRVLRVRVEDRTACPLYTARVLEEVRVAPSPEWMQQRLRACGVRPLNVVIDVTNYVMLELGQPLHAFDARSIPNRVITVRRARAGERLRVLDGRTHDLKPTMLVIASSKSPIAVAGIMGGEESGIKPDTKTIVLESAVFDPLGVRRTRKQLGCASESSYRFERIVDPHTTAHALDRAAAFLAELAGATIVRGSAVVGKKPAAPRPIHLSFERTNAMLNLSLSRPAMTRLLKRDGCRVAGSGTRLRVTPPSWRRDLRIEEDCIEEVGRLHGYPSLNRTIPRGVAIPRDLPDVWAVRDAMIDAFVSLGATESILHPWYDERLAHQVGIPLEQHVRIRNPLSREQALLRYHLLPALLRSAALAHREHSVVQLIEAGRVFAESGNALPTEHEHCGVVCVQKNAYRVLKGMCEAALSMIGIPHGALGWKTGETRYGRGQMLSLHGKNLGHCSSIGERERTSFKLRGDAAAFEIDMDLLASVSRDVRYRAPSPYPSVRRDCAFWMPFNVPFERVETALARIDPLLVHSELFDVFEAEGKRSVAIHLTFQSPQRTLSAADVERVMARIVRILEAECHATIRR